MNLTSFVLVSLGFILSVIILTPQESEAVMAGDLRTMDVGDGACGSTDVRTRYTRFFDATLHVMNITARDIRFRLQFGFNGEFSEEANQRPFYTFIYAYAREGDEFGGRLLNDDDLDLCSKLYACPPQSNQDNMFTAVLTMPLDQFRDAYAFQIVFEDEQNGAQFCANMLYTMNRIFSSDQKKRK